MAEEIDIENCNFRNFRSPWPWRWIGSKSYWCTCGRGLPTHQITSKSEKLFCGHMYGRMYGWTHLTSVSLLGHHQAMT